jgi:hypothetical protein
MNSENGAFCFIDIDVDNFRLKLGTAAAFVDATDSRYGLSSKKLFLLGGSEIARLQDMIETDHGTNFVGINIDGDSGRSYSVFVIFANLRVEIQK